MTVEDLIGQLLDLDQNLPVRVLVVDELQDELSEDSNFWVTSVEVSDTGENGYEIEGEVRLIANE